MKQRTPKELIWMDIKTVDEFLKIPVAREVLSLYNDMWTLVRRRVGRGEALCVLNEVFFQANRVMFENEAKPVLREYLNDIKANTGRLYTAEKVLWLTMCLLSMAGNDSEGCAHLSVW